MEHRARRVEQAVQRLDSGAKKASKSDKLFEIKARIRATSQDFRRQLHALSNGSQTEYQALKKGTFDDYALKLESYVDAVAPKKQGLQSVIKGAKKKKKIK